MPEKRKKTITINNNKDASHIRMSGWEREKRKVLRRCLKTASDCADVTWNGRSFHLLAPATANAVRKLNEHLAALQSSTFTLCTGNFVFVCLLRI